MSRVRTLEERPNIEMRLPAANARVRAPKGSGVSWWTAHATGPRDDVAFSLDVEKYRPKSSGEDGMMLRSWVGEVA